MCNLFIREVTSQYFPTAFYAPYVSFVLLPHRTFNTQTFFFFFHENEHSGMRLLVHPDTLSLGFTLGTRCLLSHTLLPSIFHRFFRLCIVFILSLPGFSPTRLSLFHSLPQGDLALTDICQWRDITTIADVEMLIPSPFSPRLPPPQVCGTSLPVGSVASSCFCPLEKGL